MLPCRIRWVHFFKIELIRQLKFGVRYVNWIIRSWEVHMSMYWFIWFIYLHDYTILLMAEILHQLIGGLSHYLQCCMHPRWCVISSINRMHFRLIDLRRCQMLFWFWCILLTRSLQYLLSSFKLVSVFYIFCGNAWFSLLIDIASFLPRCFKHVQISLIHISWNVTLHQVIIQELRVVEDRLRNWHLRKSDFWCDVTRQIFPINIAMF